MYHCYFLINYIGPPKVFFLSFGPLFKKFAHHWFTPSVLYLYPTENVSGLTEWISLFLCRNAPLGLGRHACLRPCFMRCKFWLLISSYFFLSPSIIAIYPRTFSNRVWRSLLMACTKHIQWCISYIKLNHIDWVWFLIHEVFQITHNDAPQSVGFLWTNDQLVPETSTWQHTTLNTDRHPCPRGGVRTHNISRRAAPDLRLRPRGHWDRLRR